MAASKETVMQHAYAKQIRGRRQSDKKQDPYNSEPEER
jgi:hypothetical protein